MEKPVEVVFGTAGFGYDATAGLQTVSDKNVLQSMLDEFKKHGHKLLDSARIYGSGTTETILSDVGYEAQGFIMATKVPGRTPGCQSAENVQKYVELSLQALKTNKVDILYLHSPDRATPFEETYKAIDEEYKKGRFQRFGISNFSVEDVKQFIKIAEEKGYVKPTVYQGQYNLVVRGGEEQLFPLLKKHGISFYAFSPIAGGFLVDSSKPENAVGRFDPNVTLGQMYRKKYYKESHFKALEVLKEVGKKHNFTVSEIALRWLAHHSQLKGTDGDAIIVGGSKLDRLQPALADLEKPALPADVLKAIDEVWEIVKGDAAPYDNSP